VAEVRGLVLYAGALMAMGRLSQEKMTELGPAARHGATIPGIFEWEREFMRGLADLFEAEDQPAIDAAEARLQSAMQMVPDDL